MIFKELPMEGAYLVELEKNIDDRGFFSRLWCEKQYKNKNLNPDVKQINNSINNKKGTLRGLHFQYPPKSETKIVRCISGAIWDVIVDVRINSKTYGKWYGEELSSDNRKMMYVPSGFAHGFISLSDNSEIIYLSSQNYDKGFEGGLHWDDPFHGIVWPMNPIVVSQKDNSLVSWNDKNSIKGDLKE